VLEGLPPNHAAYYMRLNCDQRRARAVVDLIMESFDSAEAAAGAFEAAEPAPAGPRDWIVEVYFGDEPDERALRDLVALAAGDQAARNIEFGRTPERDWVANALAGLAPVRAGRFLIHGAHDRGRVRPNDIAVEIEAALAFGTGHHGTTRGCLLLFEEILRGRRPRRVLDVGCGTGVLAIAAAKTLRRSVAAGDVDAIAVDVARDNARLNGVGAWVRPILSRGVEQRELREGGPYEVIFANILARPLARLAPALAPLIAPGGKAIVSGLQAADAPLVLSAWRAQRFFLARRLDLEGWTSLLLHRD
jgi:ribosomal protein L11 methyltransferase